MEDINTYHVLMGESSLSQAIIGTDIPGLDLVPSGMDLSGAEIELVNMERREYRLRQALEQGAGGYDYVFIDCPPALGLLTVNALVAARAVLVPLQCEFYALEGISHLMNTVEVVRNNFNPTLYIQGIVLTMFDGRNNLSNMVANDVRAISATRFSTRSFRAMSGSPRRPPMAARCWSTTPAAPVAAYLHLAGEVLRRERRVNA